MERTIGGSSSDSVSVALLVLGIAINSTFTTVVVIRTASVLSAVVSGVVTKITLLPSGSTAFLRVFLLGGSSLKTGFLFRFGDGCNSGL